MEHANEPYPICLLRTLEPIRAENPTLQLIWIRERVCAGGGRYPSKNMYEARSLFIHGSAGGKIQG